MSENATPFTDEERYLASISGQPITLPDAPLNRENTFLAAIAGENVVLPPQLDQEPIKEQLLRTIAENGGGGGDITLVELQADENKVYTPDTGKAYKKVTVSVPIPATQEQLDSIAEGIGVATPSTPASIEAQVDELIADANTATGEADETLTDAVGTLIDAMPSGSISITENGTADVAQYARAEVNVPLPLEAKYSADGHIYTEHVVVPDEITSIGEKTYSIEGIKSINLNNVTSIGHYACGYNINSLVSLICPKLTSTASYLSINGQGLETVQLGSIGYPVTSLPTINWLGTVSGRTSGGFTITIYVDAEQWADIPAEVTRNPMGGSAEFCTALIYRNSATGEVLEG